MKKRNIDPLLVMGYALISVLFVSLLFNISILKYFNLLSVGWILYIIKKYHEILYKRKSLNSVEVQKEIFPIIGTTTILLTLLYFNMSDSIIFGHIENLKFLTENPWTFLIAAFILLAPTIFFMLPFYKKEKSNK